MNQMHDSKLRVIIVTSYWKDSNGGGIKTFLVNLVNELEGREVKVDVIFKEGQDPANFKISDDETNSLYPLRVIRAYARLLRLKPQVIHMHGELFYYLVAGYICKIFNNTTLVYTFHTEPKPGEMLSSVNRILLQTLLNRCDYVTFVSKALRDKVESIWGLRFKNAVITYAGVNSKNVDLGSINAFFSQFKIDRNSIILLSLGMTALSYKAEGLKILIKAFKRIHSQYPNTVLVATRNGSYINELREFTVKEGLQESVIFTGDLKNPYAALASCDIYTHISLGEGLPIALLEAMSMGKPIIATPVGGIPEAIKNGFDGVLVPPDVDKLADGLLYLIEHGDFARMLGNNAKETAKGKFSWKRSCDAIMLIYSKKFKINS